MAGLRCGFVLVLTLLLAATTTLAQSPPPAVTPGLYDRPVLAIDPGMHTAIIRRAAADALGRWAVTGSDDKTVRVWSLADGTLLRTIRLPAGPEDVGKVYAVAMNPDGALIAAGGWTRWTDADPQQQIYLFDRATGMLLRRIEGLPDVVLNLAFSPDGQRLAAVLGMDKGLRIYSRERDWAEVARDGNYGDTSYGVAFAPDGRLATAAYDGKVRLYTADLTGNVQPALMTAAPGIHRPASVTFSSDNTRLAVGYRDSPIVTLLDGHTLATLAGPDLSGINNGYLSTVAWSRDGQTLFAGGAYWLDHGPPVLAWSKAGAGPRRTLLAGTNTMMSLVPLPDGDLLVAAQDPWLAQLQVDGSPRWVHGLPQADFRDQRTTLAVSDDGMRVGFGFEQFGKAPARFNLTTRALTLNPLPDTQLARPRQEGLPIADWVNTEHPTLAGQSLPLQPHEISRSLAVHPAGDRFVLGTEWSLRAFDAKGAPLWTRDVPSTVWAITITGDGRLVVAAYGDGTIRWHRMSDGMELLAFMPLADRSNWVAWTPEGFYAATPGANTVLRWHVNRGWNAPAEEMPVADIAGSFRPTVLPLVLRELETPRALGLALLTEHNKEVEVRTHSGIPPGAQLHLLTIGISAYNTDYAKNLRLAYADRDAQDLASAIKSTQGSLYSRLILQVLSNQNANKAGILRALKTMQEGMAKGTGNDLAVVHFSGHSALIDGKKLYLLPYEVDARDAVGIKANGLSLDEFRGEVLELANYGRVLVLLDACHSGATTMDGAPLTTDATALRTGLAAANVTVLTSSSRHEVSREDPQWGHGAFTKVLLDALNDPAADPDRKGLINTSGLAHYVATHVSSLTNGKQTPDMEVRFDTTVFASSLQATIAHPQ